MDTYEAIFSRRSVRKYTKDRISEDTLSEISHYFNEIPDVFGEINTAMTVYDGTQKKIHFVMPGEPEGPYYLIFYSESCVNDLMNIGYRMEKMALYLVTLGLGSCILSNTAVRKNYVRKGELQVMGLMTFGRPRGSLTRQESEYRRYPLEKICYMKEQPEGWTQMILRAARLAPSVNNSQPWRFVVTGNRIHVFSGKHRSESMDHHHQELLSFGAMFAHITTAAEELWVDVDLIRLEHASGKHFPDNRYILTAVLSNGAEVFPGSSGAG